MIPSPQNAEGSRIFYSMESQFKCVSKVSFKTFFGGYRVNKQDSGVGGVLRESWGDGITQNLSDIVLLTIYIIIHHSSLQASEIDLNLLLLQTLWLGSRFPSVECFVGWRIPETKNIIRSDLDARFVLSLGAKVNNNKCRVIILNEESEQEGKRLQIDRSMQFACFDLPPFKN